MSVADSQPEAEQIVTALRPIAHISPDGREHGLLDPLHSTAKLASQFAAEFGCSRWGYIAGLWHDLGKFSREFQEYIHPAIDPDAHIERTKSGRVDHSAAGGLRAGDSFGRLGLVFASLIAGHHAGLLDWADETGSNLERRLTGTEASAFRDG